ncbi:cyanidin 3-O-galactoside 2''-O-xylosyltransferase FGGT1-like [Apium graveolens]|uniref:cyanidin 3-O-galactoside 2''-O-xylosyltransferase FGGT1-like n=1 Tax=Apium graveolens TaxID=4045 RepID=UPI003D7ACBEF
MDDKSFLIAMYPWFAMGHLTTFLHLSNKLAERGHKIFFFVTSKTLHKLEQFNLHRDLIVFIPITVPHVEGLPPHSETTADITYPMQPNLMTAMDMTQPIIEASLKELKPHFVFFDFTHWLPSMARHLGIKTIYYCTLSSAVTAYLRTLKNIQLTETGLMEPPEGFPLTSMIRLYAHEARQMIDQGGREFGKDISFFERILSSYTECDAVAFKTCRELEGPYCEYVQNHFKKPILLAGPVVPEPPTLKLDEKWAKWLGGCKPKSVIFCTFGSECVLRTDQFQELVLGFELTGLPFLAALRPPFGAEIIDAALPEGFAERIQGRGVVDGGWIQQQLILAHPSVGCFVTHCGYGSLSEGLLNECQLVLLPSVGDQFINARMMSRDLKLGVEVEKEEDGMFTRLAVCEAIQLVMDIDSKVGKEVKQNHGKFRELLLQKGFENSYIDGFFQKMQELLQ